MTKSLPVLQEKMDPTTSEIALPELQEGSLSWEELDCVLADLDDFAEIDKLTCRSAGGEEVHLSDIVIARQGFVDGIYHGMQIHYEFADGLWVDTFLRESNGARLVRMSDSDLQSAMAREAEASKLSS